MLDLFSGIGGFSLAASWVWKKELEIVSFCECDKFCQQVLKKHWPNVPICENVKDLNNEWIVTNANIGASRPRNVSESRETKGRPKEWRQQSKRE
jgi:site-specific DNA-cytosine methylase